MPLTLRRGMAPRLSNRVLSYAEDKYLAEKEKQMEQDLSRKEISQGVNWEPRDEKLLTKKLADVKAIRSKFATERLEGKDRARAEKEISLIEQAIAKKWGGRIPSHTEYWMRPKEGGIRYLNLVDSIVRNNSDREYAGLIQRWKFLRRSLEPNDRRIDNTMHLHKL